ncbi:MAG TPA: class I SAM-dependent methyltransferase, partial [Candidatus Bathyarchaeia archaeon]|nr:class I SAM-dependent methyltransferase [Candidatus Bathyarchaeia archaeon]
MYDSKARYVRNLFSKVPLEYDLLLALLSFGQDRKWRAFVVEQAEPRSDSVVLDVATGTGLLAADFANSIADEGLVVGVDLTLSMLKTAKERLRRRGMAGRTDWVLARAENLPFREDSFRSS